MRMLFQEDDSGFWEDYCWELKRQIKDLEDDNAELIVQLAAKTLELREYENMMERLTKIPTRHCFKVDLAKTPEGNPNGLRPEEY